jgi:hypothetical protein
MTTCNKAPKGWKCTRVSGHTGPCAAVKVPWWKQLITGIGTAIGQSKFGG